MAWNPEDEVSVSEVSYLPDKDVLCHGIHSLSAFAVQMTSTYISEVHVVSSQLKEIKNV